MSPITPNLRSASYWLIQSEIFCLSCDKPTLVFAFGLPAGYEALDLAHEPRWVPSKFNALLGTVTLISDSVATRIRQLSSNYRYDEFAFPGPICLNYCQHCNNSIPEADIYEEDEGPYGETPYQGDVIRPHFIDEPFEGAAIVVAQKLPFLPKRPRSIPPNSDFLIRRKL